MHDFHYLCRHALTSHNNKGKLKPEPLHKATKLLRLVTPVCTVDPACLIVDIVRSTYPCRRLSSATLVAGVEDARSISSDLMKQRLALFTATAQRIKVDLHRSCCVGHPSRWNLG